MDSEPVKKKRGRKPKNKNFTEDLNNNYKINENIPKKRRGRKKKYEVEFFNRASNNKNVTDNFNHQIAYSDDEEYIQVSDLNITNTTQNTTPNTTPTQNTTLNTLTKNTTLNTLTKNITIEEIQEKQVKNVSFGNLNIIVSKKINVTDNKPVYSNDLKKGNIVEDEYSDEDKEVDIQCGIQGSTQGGQNSSERFFKDNKKYITHFTENSKKNQKSKNLRIITTLKTIIKNSEWPDKTDVCCWWCCHKFDNSPCTLPIKYNELTKVYEFIGIFCSWNCTKAYNNYKNDHKKYERGQLITMLVKQLYGIEYAISIKSAPFRECLKMFGGYMNIDEFRDSFYTVDAYSLNLLKFKYIYPEITEITNIDIKKNSNLRLTRAK
jgi:hypothetical protein